MIMSFARPVIRKHSSLSIVAKSPVCSQPSSSMARCVASGSSSYPFITRYPRVHSSPCSPTSTVSPAGETILTSVFAHACPTVDTRRSKLSSTDDNVITGELSVCPYPTIIPSQCISFTTRFMISTGQGAPAIIPVRSELRSNVGKAGCSSSAMNIVGTP